MVMAPDAATLMQGMDVNANDIADMARGDYTRNVKENLPRDYVQFYHPDGTTSIVQLPPLGRNGKGLKDRQQKITHYVLNKRREGRQWWFTSPPSGWQASALRWRCPVQECSRRGGLPDLLNLYRHIMQKHPGEKDLYEGVIKAIKQKLAEAIPADLATLLNEDGDQAPIVSQGEIEVATFADAATVIEEEFPEPPVVFASEYDCTACDWKPKPDAQQPRAALMMHRKHKHKEG